MCNKGKVAGPILMLCAELLLLSGCRDSRPVAEDMRADVRSDLDSGLDVVPDSASPDTAVVTPDASIGCVHPKVVKDCNADSQGIEWCRIPGGCFQRGTQESPKCLEAIDTRHEVTLTRAFEIQATEVTSQQFNAVMGYNPSGSSGCGSNCPVGNVSWHEAVAYCNALSKAKGLSPCFSCSGTKQSVVCQATTAFSDDKIYACPGYRLPTDAEWEYAYRASTTTAFYSGAHDESACLSCSVKDVNADAIAWYCFNSGLVLHPVAQKQPNPWGLHDMSGNIGEWCNDWYDSLIGSGPAKDPWGPSTGGYRLLRGGHVGEHPWTIRASFRDAYPPEFQLVFSGFRCVRTVK